MLALVDSLRHFSCYVLGRKLKDLTDNSALQWLRTFKEPVGQMARLIERLAKYCYDIKHLFGSQYANANAFSCYPVRVSAVSVGEIKCSPKFKADFVQ